MSSLIFTVKAAPQQRVDVAPLIPERLTALSLPEIAAIPLQCGNRSVRTDAVFDIAASPGDTLEFRGATDKLDFLGKSMTQGSILVAGNAGSYCGMYLAGGRISVQGNVDAYAACEMKRGELLIGGHVGDFLAAALPGNKKGLQGGTVIVKGDVGDRCGDHMRRGTVLIEGNAGGYLGARMTAGTIAVLGQVGPNPGYAMRRGTLLLLTRPAALPVTFNDCGSHTLGFLPLLLKSFAAFDTRFAALSGTLTRVQRYAGDLAELGKGEILVAL